MSVFCRKCGSRVRWDEEKRNFFIGADVIGNYAAKKNKTELDMFWCRCGLTIGVHKKDFKTGEVIERIMDDNFQEVDFNKEHNKYPSEIKFEYK